MAFPIPFVAGAVIGAVSTYVYKDEAAKQWFSDTSSKLKNSTKSLFKKKTEATDSVAQNGEVIEGSAEEVIKSDVAPETTEADTKTTSQDSKSSKDSTSKSADADK